MVTRMLYAVPNQVTTHRIVPLNLGTPTFMRAPGETTGSFALESAMDELAVALNMDPLALRIKNYADADPQENKPWSGKSLRECYQIGAEKFGWSRRSRAPRSMREGNTLIGLGMATATYPANRSEAAAIARILPDGTAMVGLGHAGYRHRHVHGDDPGRRRCARLRARKHPLRARRFVAAARAGVGRLAIGGERVARRARRGEPGAQPADRAGARRSGVARVRHRARATSPWKTAG